MHFDNIEIIIKTAHEIEISHILRYTSMLFKTYGNTNRVIKILPEQINISAVATSDKSHKQTDDKIICVS